MSLKQNITIVMVAIVVAVFVSLYPVVDCEARGCPNAVHSALGATSAACVVGVLSVVSFALPDVLRSLSSLRFGLAAMSSQTCVSTLFRPPRV
ncbi:hypothetical protein [Rubrobacter indicoceani]|uniref:hypothetical protein n=1 Tax=Rubrobacter indicoceani TaxID=2051957 RepID=UPI0013C4BB11|nr:hypothetical protein [Rubrobacter indicoceani]